MSTAVEGAARRLLGVTAPVEDDDLPPHVTAELAPNALRIVGSHTLQNSGDRVVDAKTVLPWVLASVGAPAGLIGLLVPVRESGSLLPQVLLLPWVRRQPVRKWLWVIGAGGQALAAATMALITATATGTGAGVGLLAALAVFALARSLSSIASKDVLGRTVPKGLRGRITGVAAMASGFVAITLGVAVRVWGGADAAPLVLAAMLGAGALTWVGAGAVFATVVEPPGTDDAADGGRFGHAWALLRDDAPFRRFVVVRTLLLVSALSPPFVVALAARHGAGLGGLGPFLIASGLAGLLTGRLLGRFADRSSRGLMMAGAAAASAVIVALLVVLTVPRVRDAVWLYPVVYLLLAVAHTGARIARKTYVVDLGSGNQRTDYVAVSNTVIGVLLLVTGAISGALAQLGVEVALGFLAMLGVLGALLARTLPEVSRDVPA